LALQSIFGELEVLYALAGLDIPFGQARSTDYKGKLLIQRSLEKTEVVVAADVAHI